jgi:hypothetical protein
MEPVMRLQLATLLLGCILHPADSPILDLKALSEASKTNVAYSPGPGLSGTWFDTSRSGEGLVLQMLPDGSWVAVWFTYPAEGEAGEQAWLLGTSSVTDMDTIKFSSVVRPLGARFGAAFNPGDVNRAAWGSFEIQVQDCGNATLRYSGPAAYGSGERTLTRFSEIDEIRCTGERKLLANGSRSLEGLRSLSGTWFVPTRSGEGWLLEEFPDGRIGVYWFTFDEAGQQRWIAGVGRRQGNRLQLEQPFLTRGARFGEAFDSADVVQEPFGSIALEFNGCRSLALEYDGVLDQYGAARRDTVQLTSVAGLVCIDGTPTPASGGTWVMRTGASGGNFSEMPAATLEDGIYALGGFGVSRGFRRYLPREDRWESLPPLPEGRDHLAAFAWAGSVYMVGGATEAGAIPTTPGYRFDLAAGNWQPVPELRTMFGSHAAVLHGKAYIGDVDGSLQEFDLRSKRNLRILPPVVRPQQRDHAQVVAFQDEIWVLGGREPLTGTVEIFDPVSRRWREGPFMKHARSGHAAAVVGNRIVVAGGERVDRLPATLVPQAEIFTVGDLEWRAAPNMPVPVHGAPGASWGGRFFVISGSTLPGLPGEGVNRMAELVLPNP